MSPFEVATHFGLLPWTLADPGRRAARIHRRDVL